MKRKIRADPFIGKKDTDETFQYEEGRFTIRYELVDSGISNEKKMPRWMSIKIRSYSRKLSLKNLYEGLADFWHYQKWLILFHPYSIMALVFVGLIIYTGAVELQPGKGYVIRWMASRAMGISPDELEYRGAGWIRVSGVRTTAVDRKREPFYCDVNVFRWLVFNDTGSVTRYRGTEYGTATYPLRTDESGEVYLKKEGEWRTGKTSNGIKWDKPQGTGTREGKIKGETVEIIEGKPEVRDK